MSTLTEVVRRHGPEYLERHGASVLPSHVRAIRRVSICRTAALGGHVGRCESCQAQHLLYHSCRHRACPQCGTLQTTRWLERQRELLLPVPYFHVVFTLPSELRRAVRSNQRVLLPVLFRAAYDSLAELCLDPRFLGARIGALAVLHTWTRTLGWHPHVHMLVPGGGLGVDGETWVPVPSRCKRYLVPIRALSAKFRGRFMALARQALPDGQMPSVPAKKPWVTFAKPVVRGAGQVLEYLGRYVHKTAIGNHAVVAVDERTVTFRYTDCRDHRRKLMTLPADEFLRRFLQHVPPKGFHRVRCFGLLQSRYRTTLRRLQLMLSTTPAGTEKVASQATAEPSRTRCPACGERALVKGHRLTPEACLAFSAAQQPEALGLAKARAPPLTSNSIRTQAA